MTPALERLRVGRFVQFTGPRGRLTYSNRLARRIGMVAGGSGVTPMWQLAAAALGLVSHGGAGGGASGDGAGDEGSDETELSLVYANVTEADILLRTELDALAQAHPRRFRVHHTLESPAAAWGGGAGRVDVATVRLHLPPPGAGVRVLVCGPPPMEVAVLALLKADGYDDDHVFTF
jgi:cytochrome-b5 reductase